MIGVRRPTVDDEESQALGLEPHEVRAMLTAAAQDGPRSRALVALLAVTGARVSEVLGLDVADVAVERGHRP